MRPTTTDRRRLTRPVPARGAIVRASRPSPPRLGGLVLLGCLALLGGLALAGCVERGDFGRPKPSVWNRVALPAAGFAAATSRGEPVSPFRLTDDEAELRDRAYRFLVPASDGALVERAVDDLVATRVLPAAMRVDDRSSYHRALVFGGASAVSGYRRLSEDVAADLRLVGPFGSVAQRVLGADRVRLATLARVADVTDADESFARARVAENRCVIAWVEAGLAARAASYRFTLEHLVIETPVADAVPTERGLAAFATVASSLAGLGIGPLDGAACAGSALGPALGPERPVQPLVRKG